MSTTRETSPLGEEPTDIENKAWFSVPRTVEEPRIRLFCFAHAGGNAVAFHGWHRLMAADIEVRAVQLPGRANRRQEPPYVQMEQLLDDLLVVLSPCLGTPFAFFGHSMGALVAFELTRRLRNRGATLPAHLFVSGSGAPQLPPTRPPLHHLSEPEFLEGVRCFGGLPEVLLEEPELLAMVLPALRADFQVLDGWRYRSEPPLAIPLSAFGGDADPSTPEKALAAWADVTTGPFEVDIFTGGHFYLQARQAELVALVAHRLRGIQGN
jgi:surfactin synthase thioesterase subunit